MSKESGDYKQTTPILLRLVATACNRSHSLTLWFAIPVIRHYPSIDDISNAKEMKVSLKLVQSTSSVFRSWLLITL